MLSVETVAIDSLRENLATLNQRLLLHSDNQHGTFTILAIDHRDNLVAEMQKYATRPVTFADVVAFKRSVIQHLGPAATSLLIDPGYGFPALTNNVIPDHIGKIAPLEITDYSLPPRQRSAAFIPGWSVAALKQAGFTGAKLLIYYHPDAPNAKIQTEIVDSIVEQCQQQNIPLFLEPISYSLDPSLPLNNVERQQIIIETVRHFSVRGVDVMKVEYPVLTNDEDVAFEVLTELNNACAVAWTLLSAGASFDVFVRQARLACLAGASGVIAGRALWGEAVTLHGIDRDHFLATVGKQRMEQLASICRDKGQSWLKSALV